MSDMNPYLAAMYNTNGAAEQLTEDMQKTANAELFCKLAADNGLDLSQMSDDQVASVYAQVFPEEVAKLAAEEEGKKHEEKESKEHEAGEKEEEKEEEKESKASAYFQEKQAWVEKCAEADHMGRIMAHAFTQERDNIEKEAGLKERAGEVAEKVKERAGGMLQQRKRLMEAGEAAAGELGAHKRLLKDLPGKAERAGYKAAPHREGVNKAQHMSELAKMKWKGTAAKYAPHAAGGAVVATGGAIGAKKAFGKKDEEKEAKASAEAFEELAANHAIKVAEAAGYDTDEAAQRVSAVYTLGLDESEKIAHVQDIDTATHVRALEYLEAASYPVNWEEIFGS